MRSAWHIALKDLLVWVRDPSALGILLAMPAVLILILGSAFGGLGGSGSTAIPVAIVDLSRGDTAVAGDDQPASDILVEALTTTDRIKDVFDITLLPTERAAREQVRSGEIAAALVIPKGFDHDVAVGTDTKIEVLKDPGSLTSADIWGGVVDALATRLSAASVSVQTVVQTVERGNPAALATGAGPLIAEAIEVVTSDDAFDGVKVSDSEADVAATSALDYVGLSMVAMFLMFGAMFGAFSSIRERREQTMDRMLSTPTPRAMVVGGKMLSVFLLGMAQFAVLYTFTRFVYGVDWGDHPMATIVVGAAEMCAVTGLATLIAAFATTERAVGGIGPLVIQIQALIGGAFFPLSTLPEWIQPIRFLSVIGWTMEGWRAIQTRGAGLLEVLGPVTALLVIAAALFGVGVWRAEAGR